MLCVLKEICYQYYCNWRIEVLEIWLCVNVCVYGLFVYFLQMVYNDYVCLYMYDFYGVIEEKGIDFFNKYF